MSDETEAPKNVKVLFKWTILRADSRQYRQQSMELEPIGVQVAVEVPNTPEYVWNTLQTLQAGTNQQVDLAVLTPAGVRYVQDQVEKLYLDEEVSSEDFGGDGWDDNEPTATTKEADDGWGEETTDPVEAAEDEWEEGGSSDADEKWTEDEEGWE
jgi:hypothetical protein